MTDEAERDWRAMVGLSESHREFAGLGGALRTTRPAADRRHGLPRSAVILDTDLGGDPDDAVALAVAALTVRELALVITTDEVRGHRARFARYLLDLLGRPEVEVVAGADLGNERYFCVEDLIPEEITYQGTDVLAAVDGVCADAEIVRWVGLGPMSNIAALPRDLLAKLAVTQMGGAINYRRPGGVEHNFRLDPTAVTEVLPALRLPTFVISDVTFEPAMEITVDSGLYADLGATDAPAWARVLRRHFDRWLERFHPGSMQHDALTLATALLWPGVRLIRESIAISPAGHLSVAPHGVQANLSSHADYGAFMVWLQRGLGLGGHYL